MMTPDLRVMIKEYILDLPCYDSATFEENNMFFYKNLSENVPFFSNLSIKKQCSIICLCFIVGYKTVIDLIKFIDVLVN